MTLNKAVKELFEELNRSDLTEEEKKALNKYQRWLFGIKTTVTNNKEPLERIKEIIPLEERRRVSKALDTIECGYAGGEAFCDICRRRGRNWCLGMDESVHILAEFLYKTVYIEEEEEV